LVVLLPFGAVSARFSPFADEKLDLVSQPAAKARSELMEIAVKLREKYFMRPQRTENENWSSY
jgi:hypothetical protein